MFDAIKMYLDCIGAIFAVVKATNGASRLSAYMLRDAILKFYTNNHLFPAGLCADAECTQTWALKYGNALKRLVGRTRRICKRARTSKVCNDKGDKDHDDDDSNDGVPAAPAPGLRMLSFETLSLTSGSSGSSSSGTLSSCLSVRDSEVSRLASQLQGLRLLSKDSPEGPSVGSSVSTTVTTASLFDFAAKTDSKPADIPAGNKILPSRVFADLSTWLPEPSKGFPLSSQYAGAFDAEDVDGVHDEAPEDKPKSKKPKRKPGSKKTGPTKAENLESKPGSRNTGPEAENLKSKPGSRNTGPEIAKEPAEPLDPDFEPYLPNLYSEKRLAYIEAHAVQYGKKEASQMWNTCLQKAKMLAGVGLRELKKRKFVPKEATENPFVKVVKQAKLAAAGLRGTSLDIELDPQTMDFLKPVWTGGFWMGMFDGNYTRNFGEFLAGAFLHLRSEPFVPENRLPGLRADDLRKSDYELFVQAKAIDVLMYMSKSKSLELPGNWANVLSMIGLGG
ncbi:unnamed protein product [Symbiodinium sp. CCMP2592]|nr:unnamed protein product [Symbiodinium sp. CCMP2592]